MTNFQLFHEDIYEALKAAVASLGGAKRVAGEIWPYKPCEQGRKELLDMLNRDNPKKLSPEEVLAILKLARQAGFHHTMQWICSETGYEATPIEPESEMARLLRESNELQKKLISLMPKIEELKLKVVGK